MASLRRFPRSPYWFACFIGPDGKQRQCSTKEIERRRAQKIADRYELAARTARLGELTARQARKVIGEIYEVANRQKLPSDTIRDFFTAWIETKKFTTKPKTSVRYAGVIREFLDWLGPASDRTITQLTATEIAKYRDHLAKKHSAGSVNLTLACIQAALQDAFSDQLVDLNEASRVKRLSDSPDKSEERRPFTDEELRAILKVADQEWRGMVICGLYQGLRLGHVSLICWPNVVLEARELRFREDWPGNGDSNC